MRNITFGNALKINYQRLTGPDAGEQHLPNNPKLRRSKELELENEFNQRLHTVATLPANRPVQLVKNPLGTYIIANGPQTDTLTRYESLQDLLPKPRSGEKDSVADRLLVTLLGQSNLLKNVPEITLKYRVEKDQQSGELSPSVTNIEALSNLIRQTFRQ